MLTFICACEFACDNIDIYYVYLSNGGPSDQQICFYLFSVETIHWKKTATIIFCQLVANNL